MKDLIITWRGWSQFFRSKKLMPVNLRKQSLVSEHLMNGMDLSELIRWIVFKLRMFGNISITGLNWIDKILKSSPVFLLTSIFISAISCRLLAACRQLWFKADILCCEQSASPLSGSCSCSEATAKGGISSHLSHNCTQPNSINVGLLAVCVLCLSEWISIKWVIVLRHFNKIELIQKKKKPASLWKGRMRGRFYLQLR